MTHLPTHYPTQRRQIKSIVFLTLFVMTLAAEAFANYGPSFSKSKDTAPSDSITHGYCTKTTVTARNGVKLNIYKPEGCIPHMAFGTMPSKDNPHIVLCAEAAFTKRELGYFVHSNICGDHVADMRYYDGTQVAANNGCFVYYNGTYKFVEGNTHSELLKASKYRDGIGFEQALLINNRTPLTKIWSTFGGAHEYYRCFCEREGELCIIDSKERITFRDFITTLTFCKVQNAICLDMGGGWNHSFYRDEQQNLNIIWPKGHNHCTNWIYFTYGPLPEPDTVTVRPVFTNDTTAENVIVANYNTQKKTTTTSSTTSSKSKSSSTAKKSTSKGYKYHTVKEGENLGKIAQKYHTTVDKIKKMNPKIKDVNKIKPGMKIRVK